MAWKAGPRARMLAAALVAAVAAGGPTGLASAAAPPSIAQSVPGDQVAFGANPDTGAWAMPASRRWSGPPLLFSDAPETVPGPGILYQDDVNGPFRLFFDHVDGRAGGGPLYFGVLATNPGGAPATVTLTRVGDAGPSADYFAAGQAAERAWMSSAADTRVTLAPGQSAFLLPDLASRPAAAGQDVTGIVDGSSDAQVQISVVAQTSPAPSLTGLAVLPAAPDASGFALRGTFPHSEVTITAQADGALQSLDMGTPLDYLRGYSAVDGLAPAEDYGNYGVLYNVLIDTMGNAGRVALIFDPQGGPFAGAGLVGTGFAVGSPLDLPAAGTFAPSPLSSILVGRYTLQENQPLLLHFEWMPPAGSYLPATAVLSPY